MASVPTEPKVFISYSWTDDAHVSWVVDLAKRLMADGVEVLLDKWELKEGQDKHVFMEQMVADPTVSKVLIICDQLYADKADGRKGGVGTETLIISPDVYSNAKQEKFVPLIRERDDEGKECVPVYLRGRMYIDFCEDSDFEASIDRLLRNIYDKPELAKPVRGKTPAYLLQNTAPAPRVAGALGRLKAATQNNKPHTHALLQEFFDAFLDGMEDFQVDINVREETADDKIVESIENFRPYRDSFIEAMLLIGNYMDDEETHGKVVGFLERLVPFTEPRAHGSFTNITFDNYKFINYELFVYAIACLLKCGKYKTAAMLMTAQYTIQKRFNDSDYYTSGITAFNDYPEGLERVRNERLNMRKLSFVGHLLGERASNSRIPFRDLVQADLILFLSGMYPGGNSETWYPRCAPYVQGTLEFFAKASTPNGEKALKLLFRVPSIASFLEHFARAEQNGVFRQAFQGSRMHNLSLPRALNLEELQRIASPR